jgi:hypothetical protein
LKPGAFLLSPNHHYELVMQPADGNLVLYHDGRALWSSGAVGSGASVTMQTDGNLVIYRGGVAKWNTATDGFPHAALQLQDDANLVIYHAGHPVWDWGSGYLGNQLNGWTLKPGAFLLSPNHHYELVMQPADGNLVLYHDGRALWSSGARGAGAFAVMQSDGNFVIYNGGAKWASNTAGASGGVLQVQDDSNVVIYQGSKAVWDWSSGNLSGGSSSGQRQSIVSIAESQDQYGSKVANNPATTADAGCNPYTGFWGDGSGGCPSGWRSNAWCADFVAWVWRQAGVSFTYGSGANDINAWSASFYRWGQATGNWHPAGSGYSPQPGDAAVYGNLTEAPGDGHVGVYVGGPASSPTVVNGNWTVSGNSRVWIQSGESKTMRSGGYLDGYVSP